MVRRPARRRVRILPAARTRVRCPYVPQPMPQPVVVKVHKRTFWLTIAQIIIIVNAIACILLGILAAGIGVLFLTAGRARCAITPGYDQLRRSTRERVHQRGARVFFAVAVVSADLGIIDLILGIVVGRPSNVARWIIIVLDVISMLIRLRLRHVVSAAPSHRTAGVPGWQGDRPVRAPDRPWRPVGTSQAPLT